MVHFGGWTWYGHVVQGMVQQLEDNMEIMVKLRIIENMLRISVVRLWSIV